MVSYRAYAVALFGFSATTVPGCHMEQVFCSLGIIQQTCPDYVDPKDRDAAYATITTTIASEDRVDLVWTPGTGYFYSVLRESRPIGTPRSTPTSYVRLPGRNNGTTDKLIERGRSYTYYLDASGGDQGPPPNSNIVQVDFPETGPPVVFGQPAPAPTATPTPTPQPTPQPTPTPDPSIGRPTGLELNRATGSGHVELTWTGVPGVQGYVIERRSGAETAFVEIGRALGGNQTFYEDVNPVVGERSHYRVAGYGETTIGPPSDERSIAIECTGCRATATASASKAARISVTGLRVEEPTRRTVTGKQLRAIGQRASGSFRLQPGARTPKAVRRALGGLSKGTLAGDLQATVADVTVASPRVQLGGPVLLTGRATSLCVRLSATTVAGRTSGTATVLGGTGAAARLRGTIKLSGRLSGAATGTVKLRRVRRTLALPAGCRSLR